MSARCWSCRSREWRCATRSSRSSPGDRTMSRMLVAVLGTTISPYLFFWQASQEVEEQRATPGHEPLREAPDQARAHLARIKLDTYLGMLFSNLIAFCIMLTTAATLHAAGSERHPGCGAGGAGAAAARRRVRVRPVRRRNHRHRPARRAGARRLGRLRGRRDVPLADRPGAAARRGARLLRHPDRRHGARRADRPLGHRLDEGADRGPPC